MPKILDNISASLLGELRQALPTSQRADFCVGYFNLRGWKLLSDLVDDWSGSESSRVRLLVGMQELPEGELRSALSILGEAPGLDNRAASRLKRQVAEQFRAQLMFGAPTSSDEAGLRTLSAQLKAGKVQVKLYLRTLLHAKLYLLHRQDFAAPRIAYVGSSNLTFSGLKKQAELNIDVVDSVSTQQLADWFDERWADRWAVDISLDLAAIIDESWAGEQGHSPYEIYLKMAYHLSREARAGVGEFRIPRDLEGVLFPYQAAAVQIAAHHLNKRGGVMLGDVVGLGKTLMATALVRVMQEVYSPRTLIICPVNLVPMWEDYVQRYRLTAKVLPISRVSQKLPDEIRYQLVLIDESHNLRNREGRRYRAIQEYITLNDSKVILLSATPYNKGYADLGAQLRLFVSETTDLGIRPEALIREIGESGFVARHQAPVRSIAAFEKSAYPDDWRDLMRLYLVRRTRSFVQANYATQDPEGGRSYLTFASGLRSYFPVRRPRTVTFQVDESDPQDAYARLYAPSVVQMIGELALPRYGLGNYIHQQPPAPPTAAEAEQLRNLGRAGKRLIGFSRTNLFKRLESGGATFVQSLERHILRNYIFLHALDAGKPLPIGPQNAELLDERDDDEEALFTADGDIAAPDEATDQSGVPDAFSASEAVYRARAAQAYGLYETNYKKRFRWVRSTLFTGKLAAALRSDAQALLSVLEGAGEWRPESDPKLNALFELLAHSHPQEKVLVFTQFADTVAYLVRELRARGLTSLEGVAGSSANPTELAWRFSPHSNGKSYPQDQQTPGHELRVLIATDVLSEGQNLQDAHIVVNFDLPWAIIRLIQRAGRVDRIGQSAGEIQVYSFLPADGVERLIKLRARVRQRLQENAEVVGTDERFFEDDEAQKLFDLYNEKSGLLDGDADSEVDLASYAFSIWEGALKADPALGARIPGLPDVVYSSKAHSANNAALTNSAPNNTAPEAPAGVLVYTRTTSGYDALAWMNEAGESVTQSQLRILQAAECLPGTPAVPRLSGHHELVQAGVVHIHAEEASEGGQLGKASGPRARSYERLKRYAATLEGSVLASPELLRAIDDLYLHPLRAGAGDILSRQLKSGINDEILAALVLSLRDDERLSLKGGEDEAPREPQIICSLGLSPA